MATQGKVAKASTTSKSRPTSSARSTKASMTGTNARCFYLLSVSRDHVVSARSLQIVQACHGAKAQVQRMKPGDGIVFYSARHQIKGKDPCQRFTAIATVAEGGAYQERVTESFEPWRRHARFEDSAREVDVKAVLGQLECFKRGAAGWGWALRRGSLRISEEDYRVLWQAMVGTVPD